MNSADLSIALSWSRQVLYLVALLVAIVLLAARTKGPARKLGVAGFLVLVLNMIIQQILYGIVPGMLSRQAVDIVYSLIGFGGTLVSVISAGLLVAAVITGSRTAQQPTPGGPSVSGGWGLSSPGPRPR